MPLDAGKNFAPVKPLQEVGKVSKEHTYSSMNSYWRDKYQECVDRSNPDARREIIETARNIHGLRAGKLTMKRDTIGGGYVFFKKRIDTSGANRSNFPLFPQNSELLKAKWAKSKPSVLARLQGDGYKSIIQANEINTMMAYNFKEIFTPEYELNEALSAQDFGTYITEFYIDDDLNQLRMIAPVVQNVSKTLVEGYGACKSCGHETTDPKDFLRDGGVQPQCPKCDSYKTTKMVDPLVMDQAQVVDAQLITQGDVTGCLLEWPSVLYDPRRMAHDSSFLVISKYVSSRLVRSILKSDLQGMTEDYELSVSEQFANRGGNSYGLGENNLFTDRGVSNNDRQIMRRMYLKVEEYAGDSLEKDEESLAGTIPAGVPFDEIWPNGVCVTIWNDGSLTTSVTEQKPRVQSGAYYIQSFSGHGKGLNDSIDIAKDLNELHSMAMAGLKRFGAGGVFFDKDSATAEQVADLFKPNKAVPLDLSKNGAKGVGDVIGQIQTNPVNPVLPQYAIQLSNLLNMSLLTGDFTQGMTTQVDINTFGGQQLAHAKAEEQKGAIVLMKVAHREGSAYHIHELNVDNGKMARFYSLDQNKQGVTKGKWITGSQLPKDVKFDAVPDSEISVNSFEKRMASQEFIEKAGGMLPLAEAFAQAPKLVAATAKTFGADLPLLDEEQMQIVCLARVDDIKEKADFFGDPQATLQNLSKPLFLRENDHILKADFISEMLDDDEVQTWSPVVRATVQALIEMHHDLAEQAKMNDAMRSQQAAGMVQAQANQMMMAQAAPMMQQQQAQADKEKHDQIGAEILNRVADEESKESDHDRSEESADKAHQRSLELEKAKAANKPQGKSK